GRIEGVIAASPQDIIAKVGPIRAALGDRVWEDLNGNGIQDCTDDGNGIIGDAGDTGPECDAGIPNIQVELLAGDCSTPLGLQTFTDGDGFYLFENLAPGDYCVQFSKPDSTFCETETFNPGPPQFTEKNVGGDDAVDSDANTGTGLSDPVNLAAGETDRTVDAGVFCPAKLGDQLIEDQDGDGIQDPGEPGVPGQTVELIECVGGVPGAVIDTTVTDADGMYMFNPLEPGEYAVRFSKPGDTIFSPQDQGGDDTIDCDTDMDGLSQCVTLGPKEYNDTVDACVVVQAGLGDRVWEDLNADGIQDGGEPGIPDVIVNLLDPGGDGDCNTGDEVVIDTTTTNASGNYQFINLDPGRYCVEFVKPDICAPVIGGASAFSPRNQGADDAVDSDADTGTGQTGNIDLDPNDFDPTNDAGVYCPAKIGDRVWNDTNENGIQDGGEPDIPGVAVNLFDCGPDGLRGTGDDGGPVGSAATDANGMYMFNPLQPGYYSVECVKPDGFMFSPQDQGGDDTVDSDADTATGQTVCTYLESNEYDPTWDCVLYQPREPGIDIEKATNGVDADDPNAGDAPQVGIGNTVTWTYKVTNTGNVTLTNVMVNDDQGVTVSCPTATLAPGEMMECTASGPAEDLGTTIFTVVPGLCGGIPQSPLYENKGKATGEWAPGQFVEDEDPSHYCNPQACELKVDKKCLVLDDMDKDKDK
ncbi:MAG: SdrD B-like domain-containing protein, partial [Gammaproteobacteria bacterium]